MRRYRTPDFWESFHDNFIYIHNWPLQAFSQDYGLTSHTNHDVCVNFIDEWRNVQLKIDSKRRIFLRNFSWQFYFNTQSFCQKSAERMSPKKYFHIFILMSDLGLEMRLYVHNRLKRLLFLFNLIYSSEFLLRGFVRNLLRGSLQTLISDQGFEIC